MPFEHAWPVKARHAVGQNPPPRRPRAIIDDRRAAAVELDRKVGGAASRSEEPCAALGCTLPFRIGNRNRGGANPLADVDGEAPTAPVPRAELRGGRDPFEGANRAARRSSGPPPPGAPRGLGPIPRKARSRPPESPAQKGQPAIRVAAFSGRNVGVAQRKHTVLCVVRRGDDASHGHDRPRLSFSTASPGKHVKPRAHAKARWLLPGSRASHTNPPRNLRKPEGPPVAQPWSSVHPTMTDSIPAPLTSRVVAWKLPGNWYGGRDVAPVRGADVFPARDGLRSTFGRGCRRGPSGRSSRSGTFPVSRGAPEKALQAMNEEPG